MKQAGFNGKEEFFFVAHLYWLGMWDFQAVTFLFPIVGGHQQPLKRVTFSPSQKGHQEVFFFWRLDGICYQRLVQFQPWGFCVGRKAHFEVYTLSGTNE